MGLTKAPDDLLVAVNCTIKQDDLKLAEDLGTTVVKGRQVVNTSLGFRNAFNALRSMGEAVVVLRKIRDNPKQTKKLVEEFFTAHPWAGIDN